MSSERVLRPPRRMGIAPIPAYDNLVPQEIQSSYAQMLGLLRDISAEVQNLQKVLDSITAQETLTDRNVRAREVLALLKRNQPIYDYNAGQITTRIRELRTHINNEPILYDRYGDQVIHIENQWERATYAWPHFNVTKVATAPASEAENGDTLPTDPNLLDDALILAAENVLRDAWQVGEYLRVLIFHAGILTIPARLNQHLDHLRLGQALDFHATFEDEIPNVADRQKILEYIRSRPIAIPNGVIDAATGKVFRASSSNRRRRFSFLLIFGVFLIGILLVALASESGASLIADWPIQPGNFSDLLVAYIALMVGGIVHVAVDAIKQARNSEPGQLLAVEDGLLWLHINETGVIVGILSLWVGYFGVLAINGSIGWQTAFLVGYSIDSFVDMFLQRFNTSITTRTAALTASLK